MTTIEVITSILILLGVSLVFLSAVGVIRLPDVYSRMHAAGKSSTLGVVFLITATFLYFLPEGIMNVKLLLAIVFVFLTAPLSALMINRSAYRTGVPLEKKSVKDELKDMYEREME